MATTKRKRGILNAVMVVLAVVVVAAGIMFFMSVRGGQNASSSYTVESKIGYANIERAGINYALDEGTALQEGDVVETLAGSEVGVKAAGDSKLYLADASKMKMNATEAVPSKASVGLESGCVFADARSADNLVALEGAGLSWTAGDAVFVSDVRASSLTVQVLSGEVSFADGSIVHAGESRNVITDYAQNSTQNRSAESGSEASASGAKSGAASASTDNTAKLTLAAMDSFALDHALEAIEAGRTLAFTKDQISGEIERRDKERRQQTEQAAAGTQEQSKDASEKSSSSASSAASEDASAGAESSEADYRGTETDEGATKATESGDAASADSGSTASGEPATTPEESAEADAAYTCTIQIRCDTILDNMDNLAEGKSKYVPKSGVLLDSTSMTFEEGESAFDVLKRACDEYGIALEYSYAPIYGSYYVEGIGNLYEFDCGDESGWMYKVNGWFPNYGCSSYALADGDAVVFCYTCRGLGEDVGA